MKAVIRCQRWNCVQLMLILGLAVVTGCRSEMDRMNQRLGQISNPQLNSILRQNINAGGSISTWLRTQKIDAQALTTILDPDGGKSLLEQNHILLPTHPLSLTLISRTPEGPWTERIDAREQVSMFLGDRDTQSQPQGVFTRWLRYPNLFSKKSSNVADPQVLQGAGLKLRLISQALTQSFGLLREDWSLTYAGQERKGGRLSHKIIVNGMVLKRELPENVLDVGDHSGHDLVG